MLVKESCCVNEKLLFIIKYEWNQSKYLNIFASNHDVLEDVDVNTDLGNCSHQCKIYSSESFNKTLKFSFELHKDFEKKSRRIHQ